MYACVYIRENEREKWGGGRERKRALSSFLNHFRCITTEPNILIIIFEFYYILIQALITHWYVWSFYKNKHIWLIKSPLSPTFALLRKSLGKAIFPEHKGKLHKERLPAPHSLFFFPLPGMKMQEDINHQNKSPILRMDKKQKEVCLGH